MDSDHDEATTEAQVQVPDQGAEAASATRAAMDAGDWRSQLQDDGRQRIVDRIMEPLRKHLDISDEEELKKIAVRFEEKIYNAAASQSEYLRKISLKMLTMETKSQTTISNKNPTDSVLSPAPRSVPSSSLEGRVIPSPSLPSPPQKKRLADDKQRLPFGARSPKRFLMAETFDVGAGIPSDGLCKNLLDHLTKGVAIASLVSERFAMVDEQKEQIKTLQEELDRYKDDYAKMIEAYDWIGDLVRAREEQIREKDKLLAERDIKIAELEMKLQEATNGARDEQIIRAFCVAAVSQDSSHITRK